MKDIHTWNELAAEVARLEQEIAELKGSRSGCEWCAYSDKGTVNVMNFEKDYKALQIQFCDNMILIKLDGFNNVMDETTFTIGIDYCPFCGRKLGDSE